MSIYNHYVYTNDMWQNPRSFHGKFSAMVNSWDEGKCPAKVELVTVGDDDV